MVRMSCPNLFLIYLFRYLILSNRNMRSTNITCEIEFTSELTEKIAHLYDLSGCRAISPYKIKQNFGLECFLLICLPNYAIME